MHNCRPDEILVTLRDHGYEAFYVGGCVRDTLLNREIHDWDITTSALPEQIMACFDHCVPTGIKHGTVTVLSGAFQAEVTTYRTDGEYLDGRHPQNVKFVRSLSEDLARRDFTINAMAMDEKGNVVDLYGGQEDLERKLIRCVGDPDKRFQEDALRILRAFRFSAQLGFSLEHLTEEAIGRNAVLCRQLSAERVRDEIEKTLCSDLPQRLEDMARCGAIDRCMPSLEHDCGWLASLPKIEIVRWAGLCRTWPRLDLAQLRLSKRITCDATLAGRCEIPENRLGWKKLIASCGAECAKIAAALENKSELVQEILLSGECLSLRQLAVGGEDFPELSGPEIGLQLNKLLLYVLEHPEDNTKEKLKGLH